MPLIFETIYKRTDVCSTRTEPHPSYSARTLCGGRPNIGPVSVAVLDLQAYLNRLSSAEPTPGGGSAATIVGALGAALIAMVARITLGSPKHAEVAPQAVLLVGEADGLRARFLSARIADEDAYAAVPRAQSLPRDSDARRLERTERLQAALTGAAEAPLHAAALAGELIALCERAAALDNTHLASDVECALAFGRAALDASAANVRINHRFMHDALRIADQQNRLNAIVRAAAQREAAARERLTPG